MVTLTETPGDHGLPSLTTPAPTLPAPVQPRIPRAPIRIIVLCDGTAQQRNWVKSSLNTSIPHPYHLSHDHSDRRCSRGDGGDKKRRKDGRNDTSTAAETDDFFTNVALLAKIIAQSSGVASTSPVQSPVVGSGLNGFEVDKAGPVGGGAGVMPQIVFYQSGVGTGTGTFQNLFDQGTGLSLGSKIEEAYSFIVDNYQPGDELFLFGFSRGAYTARCISGLINWCGVLNKVEMTHFSDIWAAYQRRDPDDIESEVAAAQVLYEATLKYPSAESEQVATSMYLDNLKHNDKLSDDQRDAFRKTRREECEARRRKSLVVPPQIKVVGVWDTVSALGFPGLFQDNGMIDFFDFYDPGLGSNIQFGFHALALEEDRKDFLPTMWYQPSVNGTPSAVAGDEFGVRGKHMRSKQVLKQCWFQGVHTDCGGGYQYHGLSDISLIWMVSQLVDPHTLPDGSTTLRPLLHIDLGLLATILDRRREWAKQVPHRSRPTINFQHYRTVHQSQWDADTMKRTVWANMAKTGATHESIHASVPRGGRIDPATHPAFAQMRKDDAQLLKKIWGEAQDWEQALRPTEKLLYWSKRGPYPWIPGTWDDAINPAIAPLLITGGWYIPELAGRDVQKMVVAAAQHESDLADVDDGVEYDFSSPTNNASETVDVDDQPTDGWGEVTSGTSAAKPTTTNPTSLPNPTTNILMTLLPTATYPLIPSKELGENPVDADRHPQLHSLWQTLYNLSSTPNAVVVDLINLGPVSKANLNQTVVQDWLWNLGDKIAGYSEKVKAQALTAGVPKHRRKGDGNKLKAKTRADGKTKVQPNGYEALA